MAADSHSGSDGVHHGPLAPVRSRRVRNCSPAAWSGSSDIDAGDLPHFLTDTASIRESEWTVASIPTDLQDRRTEITGPPDRKMVINALNSGASVFMADFEDANSPTWSNNLEGQLNLRDAINRTIAFTGPEGKQYKLNDKPATLMVRPRGWHLVEKHFLVDGKPISGSLFDFGLYFFHNAKNLLANGSGPYFYLPKLESHLEARLWNDVFVAAQKSLGVPQGSIRATVLIETILGSFEMDEILVRVARPLGWVELWALGLHLQLHQEAAQPPGLYAPQPRAGHHGAAFPEVLCGAAHPNLPQARHSRHGRHGRADPD